jgi:hypothetical protein
MFDLLLLIPYNTTTYLVEINRLIDIDTIYLVRYYDVVLFTSEEKK